MQISRSLNGLRGRIWWMNVWALLLLGACAPAGPVVTLKPSASSHQVNDSVRASVVVENITDLTAFEVHIAFDPNALEVLELKDGGFVKADFIVQNTFDNAAGTIDYAVAQIDRPPAKGSGTLLEIVFRATAPGESPVRFRETQAAPAGALFSNSRGMAIQVSFINGKVDISK